MEQPPPINLERFHEFLRSITGLIEAWAIERSFMMGLVMERGIYTEAKLLEELEKAKKNPEFQQKARAQFERAWRLLEEFGKDALFEAHLLDPHSPGYQDGE